MTCRRKFAGGRALVPRVLRGVVEKPSADHTKISVKDTDRANLVEMLNGMDGIAVNGHHLSVMMISIALQIRATQLPHWIRSGFQRFWGKVYSLILARNADWRLSDRAVLHGMLVEHFYK